MKLLYKPFGLIISVIGGILAGAIFKQVWKLVAHEDDTPDSTDVQKSWTEVLIAATSFQTCLKMTPARIPPMTLTIRPNGL